MLNWIIDIGIIAMGALCVVAFFYGLITPDKQKHHRQFTRLDRRDHERFDRRLEDLGSPTGPERRVMARRAAERS